jgi:hypothetical protein
MNSEPMGWPKGTVRAVMSLAVVLAACVVTAFLVASDPGSDMTKMIVGGWATALGNVIGFYFGARSGES